MKLIGGMAKFNGVTFTSENYTVTARRNKNRNIIIHETKFLKSNNNILMKINRVVRKIPFVRGVWQLLFSLIQNWKFFILMCVLLSLIYYNDFGLNLYNKTTFVVEYLIVLLGVILIVKLSNLGEYHGAEHKAANSIEKYQSVNMEQVKRSSRIHRHCGTNLCNFILLFMLIFGLFSKLGSNVSFLLSLSIAYEIHVNENKYLEFILKPFHLVGGLLQYFLLTSKPKEEHLEVAIAAMERLIYLEENEIKK